MAKQKPQNIVKEDWVHQEAITILILYVSDKRALKAIVDRIIGRN